MVQTLLTYVADIRQGRFSTASSPSENLDIWKRTFFAFLRFLIGTYLLCLEMIV